MRLIRDPSLKSRALHRLDFIQKVNPSGKVYHDRWAELLRGEMPALLRNMTEDSERAAVLRRESPFTSLYDPDLRKQLFQPASR